MLLESNIFSTENLSIWGAVTGTIGTLIGTLGFIIRFKTYARDKIKIRVDSYLKYHDSTDESKSNHMVVFCQGKQSIYISEIKYYWRPEGWRNYFRYFYYLKNLYIYNREISDGIKIEPNRNVKIGINLIEGLDIREITKIRIVDETGKSWKVPWFRKDTIDRYNTNKIIKEEELFEKGIHEVKLSARKIGDYYRIILMYKNKSIQNQTKGKYFYSRDEKSYNKNLHKVIDDIVPEILDGKISEIDKLKID